MSVIDAAALAPLIARWPRPTALLDIRDYGEAADEHIRGATFLPRAFIELRAERLLSLKTVQVVVYDGGDGRAELARETLAALDYANVSVLRGGLPAWKAAGGATDSGVNVPPKRFGEKVLHEDAVPSISHDAVAPGALWDVRTPREYESGSLPGSCNVAGFDTIFQAAALNGERIQVHCAGRTRSLIAAQTLRLLGLDAVAVEDGTMGWLLAGRALEHRQAEPPLREGAAVEAAEAAARRLGYAAGVPRVGRDDVSPSARWIDVRGEAEYSAGHIADSEGWPGAQAIQRANDVFPLGDAEIVCVDEREARAIVTAYWLRRMGFARAAVLAGGLARWRAEDGALEAGERLAEAPAPVECPARAEGSFGLRLDVSDRKSFIAGHAEGARWMPRGWLELKIQRLAAAGENVLVFARDPRQAAWAAAALRRLDYHAQVASGGLEAWRAAGGRVETGRDRQDDFPLDEVLPPYAHGPEAMRRYLDWEKAL